MKLIKNTTLLLFTVLLIFNASCKKDPVEETPNIILPELSTVDVFNISNTSANSGGNIVSDGGQTVTVRGVCWSLKANPTINDSKTEDGGGAGQFTSSITGLSTGIEYYVRAYATTKNGTGYGATMLFSTTNGFYFSPTTAVRGNMVTVSFFGGSDVTFTQGSNCPKIRAMAVLRQGTSTLIYPTNIVYKDDKHFDATFSIPAFSYPGLYDMSVGQHPCSREEYDSFSITD